jgi:hypothetical protein
MFGLKRSRVQARDALITCAQVKEEEMRVRIVRLRSSGQRLPPQDEKAAVGIDGHLIFKNGLATFHAIDDPDTQWIFPALRDASVTRIQNQVMLVDGTETVLIPALNPASLATITQYRQTWQCTMIRTPSSSPTKSSAA